ncbi:transporter [Streptomyces milbemycinicus]|uniref:Transporter n=1 Tax=Streptomyces milbemycinicus TaxID=476552 RepID=A0ABW8LTK6_9ACTN
MIVEYKRSTGKAVITQALSCQSWLRDHRHEFESLLKDRLRDQPPVWPTGPNPRPVCAAGDFTPHDAHAVEEIDRRIDLVSYRDFGGELLALQLVASVAGFAATPHAPATTANATSGGAKARLVRQIHDELPKPLRDLYADLDALLISPGEVQREFQLHYIAYRRIKNEATVRFQPRSHTLVLTLKVDPDTVELSDRFARDVRGIGCLGTCPLEVRIRSRGGICREPPASSSEASKVAEQRSGVGHQNARAATAALQMANASAVAPWLDMPSVDLPLEE